MRIRASLLAINVFVPLLSGCITNVDVRKITPQNTSTQHGLRYSLPATFLLVQPQADGTATYDWVYLPDAQNTYAVETNTFMSKYTLDIVIDHGLIKKAASKTDDTAVAAKMIDAAQTVYAARAQASTAAATKAAADKETAQTAASAAQLAHNQAVAEQNIIDADPQSTPAQKLAAKIKVADTEEALKAAQAHLANVNASGNVPGSASLPQAYGPVLFRVVQNGDDVRLVAVNMQATFDTVMGAKAGSSGTKHTLKILGSAEFQSSQKPIKLSVSVDPPVANIDAKSSVINKDGNPEAATPTMSLSADGATISIEFINGLAAGNYKMFPALVSKSGGAATADAEIAFAVK